MPSAKEMQVDCNDTNLMNPMPVRLRPKSHSLLLRRVLATAYWATSAQGGATRRGVVLTYRLSLVIDSQ